MSNTLSPADLTITLALPEWTIQALEELPSHLPTPEERMAAVIDFSRKNFENNTGGPFAAGVFERDTGKVVVIGVNRVLGVWLLVRPCRNNGPVARTKDAGDV